MGQSLFAACTYLHLWRELHRKCHDCGLEIELTIIIFKDCYVTVCKELARGKLHVEILWET
jgi:hypothetical protein